MKRYPSSRIPLFATLAGGALAWDLYSKHTVFESLGYPQGVSGWVQEFVGGWITFRLFTSFNEGALWGIGQGFTAGFACLSILCAVAICYWLFVRGAAVSLWLTISLSLVMAGTLGNLWDRLGMHGCEVYDKPIFAVRDFLLFTFGGWPWPVFNFADTYLVAGAVMLVLQSFTVEAKPASSTAQADCA